VQLQSAIKDVLSCEVLRHQNMAKTPTGAAYGNGGCYQIDSTLYSRRWVGPDARQPRVRSVCATDPGKRQKAASGCLRFARAGPDSAPIGNQHACFGGNIRRAFRRTGTLFSDSRSTVSPSNRSDRQADGDSRQINDDSCRPDSAADRCSVIPASCIMPR
jgi:hypothetical protein